MDANSWGDGIAEGKSFKVRGHKSYQETINIILENSVQMPREASPEAHKAELNSEQFSLLKAFLVLARERCKINGIEPGTAEALEAFEEADECAKDITCAYMGLPFKTEDKLVLSPGQVKEKLALTVPSYVQDLTNYVREHGKLGVLQQDLSAGVGRYVNGRFKSADIDRLLLQALTHVEIVAYIDEMIWKNVLTGTSKLQDASPPSILGAVWRVSKLIFLVWLISIGIVALPLLVPVLSQDLMLLIGFGIAGVGTIALLYLGLLGVAGLMKERPHKRRLQQSILDMIDRMYRFYMEFRGAGPFSLSHFKKRVNDLADTGVVWPSGLFVLIEDMEERGVRMF